jgi:hypothetical protein
MAKKEKFELPPGYKRYRVELEQQVTRNTYIYVVASSEEAVSDLSLIDELAESSCDWDDAYCDDMEFGYIVEETDMTDLDRYAFVYDGNVIDNVKEFENAVKHLFKKMPPKPLPGQMGIPGIGSDVPLDE